MAGYTIENLLILTVFQLLVSGLILSATGAVFYLQKDAFVRKILTLVGSAFCLYSLHFLLQAAFAYWSLSQPVPADLPPQWEFSIDAIEKAALVCLGLAYLPHWLPKRLHGRFWAVVAAVWMALVAGPYVIQQQWPPEGVEHLASAPINGVLLAFVGVYHLMCKGRAGLFSASPLCVLSAAQFLRATSQIRGGPEWLWGAENAASLIGLGLFALVVDARSANLQVRFFLRLNLIFVAIASLLILIVAETERRQYLRFSEIHAEEISEFLRGHVIYFHSRGLSAPAILSSPEIFRKVIVEFGRLPDLRRVRVGFQEWQMEMSIAEDGTVSRELYPETRQAYLQRPNERGRIATLTPVPIVQEGRVLGRIELDQNLHTINTLVARQMRIIFFTLTIAVFVAAGLFGLTVQHAHRTIQRQFEELQQTHTQLAHADRLASAGQVAGGTAHEINNPIGVILTTADDLLSEAEEQNLPESLREGLGIIRRQARRVSSIISGLLTFSRPTVLNTRPTQLHTVIQQSLVLLAPRFREQRIEVENLLGNDLPSITADPDRLEQVFVNLLNNAADAMPEGGKVRVEIARMRADRGSWLVVSIADTGSGIAEEHLKSIFDPFFSTKPKGRGTGLGLSVSYGIIRDHGGNIDVESRVGQGTIFRVRLPVDGMHHEEL